MISFHYNFIYSRFTNDSGKSIKKNNKMYDRRL